MSRLIDADALKPDYIVGSTSANTECYRYVSLEQIMNAPTADVRANVKGKWEVYNEYRQTIDGRTFDGWRECSNCHAMFALDTPNYDYCPDCGARLERSEDD